MSIPLVVTGATGRMGSFVLRLVQENPETTLAAALDREEQLKQLLLPGVITGSDPKQLLPQVPGGVIIDFTLPVATMTMLEAALTYGNPMVICTTGFSDEQRACIADAAKRIPLMLSPNMSVGINALLDILPKLVKALGDGYDIEISEIHHKHKKDAPSGTALRLAECLAEAKGWSLPEVARYCREGITGERPQHQIGLQTLRGGDVAGVHTVYFLGEGERIEVTHHAHSRETFAHGALRAACWLHNQPAGRLYTLQDAMRS